MILKNIHFPEAKIMNDHKTEDGWLLNFQQITKENREKYINYI